MNLADPAGMAAMLIESLVTLTIRLGLFMRKIWPAVQWGFRLWTAYSLGKIFLKIWNGERLTAWDYVEVGLAITGLKKGRAIGRFFGRLAVRPFFGPITAGLRTFSGARHFVGGKVKWLIQWPELIPAGGGRYWGVFEATKDGEAVINFYRRGDDLWDAHTLIHEYWHYLYWVRRGSPAKGTAAYGQFKQHADSLGDGPGGFWDMAADLVLALAG